MKKRFILISIISFLLLFCFNLKKAEAATDSFSWDLHTSTILGTTDSNFDFITADYNGDDIDDLYCIQKNGASGLTEVHVLDGSDNFQSYLLHIGANLGNTDDTWDFLLNDYNNDGTLDLYCISKSTSRTEIHILSGADNFQTFLLHIQTPLGSTTSDFQFDLGDYNNDGIADLYVISQQGSSNTSEVHILNGVNNFQVFLLHTSTCLSKTDDTWKFKVGYYDSDNVADVFAIKEEGENSTEIHVISGSSIYQNFILQKATPLEKTNDDYNFSIKKDVKDCASIYVIKKQGSYSTEIHHMILGTGTNLYSTKKVPSQAYDLISVATNELGYVEGDDNYSKYGAWYGYSNSAWCAMFVSWCANQANISTNIILKYHLCSDGVNWFKNNGRFHYKTSYSPQPGDIIFFINSNDYIYHTGIVEYVKNKYVHTIEGNTSDCVARRSYLLTASNIYGYGNPNYNN